jgi:diguanylate cyclase (GGDEF)-like protein/PAS domain S-box-containing protein
MSSPAPPPPGSRRFHSQTALGLALVYAFGATVWITLSDHLLSWLLDDPEYLALAGTFKGWLFVAVTSVLLYLLLRRRSSAASSPDTAPPRQRSLAYVALLALAFALLLGVSLWHSLGEEKAQMATRLQALSETRAREISSWHSERLRDAIWAQKSPYLRELWLRWRQSGKPDDALRLRQFMMNFFVNDAVFPRIEIVDAEGHVTLDNRVQTPLPSSPQATPFAHPTLHRGVLESLTSNRPMRVGPWRDADGRLRLAFLAPLAADSAYPATMVLHVDPPEHLHASLLPRPLPIRTADIFLYRQDGDALVMLSALRYEDDAVLRKRLPLNDPRYMSVRALRSGVAPGELIEGWDYRQVASYGVAQQIPGTDWWLLAKQDRAELLHSALLKSAWMVLAGGLALLAIGTALYLHDERRRLQRSAREIADLRRIERSLSESEAQYRLLAENTTDVLWLYDLAADHYLYLSPSVEQQLGYRPEEMLSFSFDSMMSLPNVQQLRSALARRLQAFAAGDETKRTVSLETVHRHKDGHTVTLEVVSTLLTDEQGRVTRLMGVSRDITQRTQAQAQLIQLSQAIEQSPASVIITDLDAKIEYVNHAFEQTSGYTRSEVQGRTPALLRSGRTPEDLYVAMRAALEQGQTWTGELVNRHKNGHEYVLSMNMAPVRDRQGRISHYLAVQLDITAQKNAEQKAYELAWFNPLTGLPNRHRLLADLEEALLAHGRTGELYTLLLLNLDRFQNLNDALGHDVGDLLLKQVGERLTGLLHADDRPAHLSGDEYALLLHTGSSEFAAASAQALRLAQSVHERLDAPFVLDSGEAISISGCIGVALLPQPGSSSPGDILRRADTALHRAKEAGTRQTAFFDTSMEQLISRRFAIERDLRRGLGADELRLYLQPQVDAQGRMVGAEALVRWQHPEHGLMLPASFIPIAEESELITELGRWVLKVVCRHLGALRREGLHLPISVNISPHQFHQPGFVHVVQDMLQAFDAAPSDLVIEITESIVMDQIDNVVRKMSHLASLGVQFSLDDFGTGYSSLAYLKRLPIQELKIDRSFVQDAPHDPSDAALVEVILSVARLLHLKVVAEGVETTEQAGFLNARGDVIQQGYLHGYPEPADALLARWRATQTVGTA